jgi:hypothetical protein
MIVELFADPRLFTMSHAEIVAANLSNGCGPGDWRKHYIPDSDLGCDIVAACDNHDMNYCNGQTWADKHLADVTFWMNMRAIVTAITDPWDLPLLECRLAQTDLYFEAVHMFGSESFWSGKVMPTSRHGKGQGVITLKLVKGIYEEV